jgi:hypothetical protein
MTSRHVTRHLTLGIAAALIAASSVQAADDRASVQGVVNDASGQPVAGAFVKLKNADRRLTFMVNSQGQGRFEAKDLPPGRYKVQGVGAGFESDWLADVSVTAGQSAKVGLSLTRKQGAMLPPAWPQRIPEEQVRTASLQLPEGDGKTLVAEKCGTCHDLRRVVVKRSGHDDWDHTVARMRTRMTVASQVDLTEAEFATVVNYLSEKFPLIQPYDANSRLPRTLLTGKARQYRAVTYDLVNNHAEPHDVATDPQGLGGGARRQARPPRRQDA